jgi:AAA ATPase domain
MDLSLFNPRFQSEADFVASFVARNKEFAFFVEQLRALKQSQAAKHHLIVAPRGFGKTSLLRRVAIAVQQDDDLSKRFIALSFREEQHNVISLDVFWRNCLQSLLETRDDEHAPAEEIDEIDAAWRRLAPRQNLRREEQNGEPAWQEFQSRCERLGRRPILLLDNLDTLLAGLPSDHQWSLRRCLQRPDGPVLLSAASRYADAMQDSKEAFYDFCRIHTLGKLDTAEVLTCLLSLAERRGASGRPVLELLDRDPGRVAALNTLAGGNPRTLGVLYVVLESHMSTDVMSQLAAMLDTFTLGPHDRCRAGRGHRPGHDCCQQPFVAPRARRLCRNRIAEQPRERAQRLSGRRAILQHLVPDAQRPAAGPAANQIPCRLPESVLYA